MGKVITRTILVLSLVSLFNDISSEMLYPIMPLFLQSIGFSTALIGFLEGLAEAIAGLSKMYFGRLSDAAGKRMPFVRGGYFMSAVSKPMLAAFTFPAWIFSARLLDRLGKGIRTGARDALLSDETRAENKATVFGFHRALDTTGAALGPVAALIYLQFHPAEYKTLFLIAFLPALFSVLLTYFISETRKQPLSEIKIRSFSEKLFYWKFSPPAFKRLMVGLLFFGLMNSSDVFLLLRAKQVFGNDSMVLMAYVFYNLVFAVFSYPLGKIADRIGMKTMIVAGLFLFTIVYGGMAFADDYYLMGLLFFLYGLFAAATEGVSKALISNTVPGSETASAMGFYTGWNSICVLIASSATGLIWQTSSPKWAFLVSGGGAFLAACYLSGALTKKQNEA